MNIFVILFCFLNRCGNEYEIEINSNLVAYSLSVTSETPQR
jgi:hypothetical protein